IETRGEGGYALAPGSPPACHETSRTYEHIAGPTLTQLADITAEEREILINATKSFDLAAAERAERSVNTDGLAGAGLRQGDDYNQRGPAWSEILEPHGWKRVWSHGDVVYWRRPGKQTPGISATTGYCKSRDGADLLAVFSTNAYPFQGPTGTSVC